MQASFLPPNHPLKRVDIDIVPIDRNEDENPEPKVHISYFKDKQAAWTKKGQQFHYGYKVHAATDIRDGFILSGHVTPANLSDTGELATVLDEANLKKWTRVYTDKAYASRKNSEELANRCLKDAS